MNLQELMQLQKQFDQRHAGKTEFYVDITDDNVRELEHLVVCLVGELGEISNIAKKIVRGDKALSDSATKSQLSEEIADVFTYLLKMCNQLGVNLESEYLNKLSINQQRFQRFHK